MSLIGMSELDILNLNPRRITRMLSGGEILYIAQALGAFWLYDYAAAYQEGKWGFHAELKCGDHADYFFNAQIMLGQENIRRLIADQMMMRIRGLGFFPDWVAGVPDGATNLAKEIAGIAGAKFAEMKKENGKIVLVKEIPLGRVLLVEDVCSTGKGFTEAILAIREKSPHSIFLPVEPVILNRGGLKYLYVTGEKYSRFTIAALSKTRATTWNPASCPLCQGGSKPIKPKTTKESWHRITTSQL